MRGNTLKGRVLHLSLLVTFLIILCSIFSSSNVDAKNVEVYYKFISPNQFADSGPKGRDLSSSTGCSHHSNPNECKISGGCYKCTGDVLIADISLKPIAMPLHNFTIAFWIKKNGETQDDGYIVRLMWDGSPVFEFVGSSVADLKFGSDELHKEKNIFASHEEYELVVISRDDQTRVTHLYLGSDIRSKFQTSEIPIGVDQIFLMGKNVGLPTRRSLNQGPDATGVGNTIVDINHFQGFIDGFLLLSDSIDFHEVRVLQQTKVFCFGVGINQNEVCSGNGACNDFDSCSCNTGYTGYQCENWKCFGTDRNVTSSCSGHGQCAGHNTCNCNQNRWKGDYCQEKVCNGLSENVCSGNGICVDNSEPISWHLQEFNYRWNLTIKNYFNHEITQGTLARVPIVISDLIANGTIRGDCRDIRVVYRSPDSAKPAVEIPYDVLNCQEANETQVVFAIQENIPVSSINSGSYFLYAGFPEASSSFSRNLDELYIFADDFTRENIKKWKYEGTDIITIQNHVLHVIATAKSDAISIRFSPVDTFKAIIAFSIGDITKEFNIGLEMQNSDNIRITISNGGISVFRGGKTDFPSVTLNSNEIYTFHIDYDGNKGKFTLKGTNFTGPSLSSLEIEASGSLIGVAFSGNTEFGIFRVMIFKDMINIDPFYEVRRELILPHSCHCNQGWTGLNCNIPLCFGMSNGEPNVCSSRGICAAPDQCTCEKDYIGSNCQVSLCFGVPSNETIVCSERGQCTKKDTCQCNESSGGPNCEFPKCFGILSNETQVCSQRGSCTNVNNCVCELGYTGHNCNLVLCYGKTEINGSCSNNGVCINPNQCDCNNCHEGSECGFNYCERDAIAPKNAIEFASGIIPFEFEPNHENLDTVNSNDIFCKLNDQSINTVTNYFPSQRKVVCNFEYTHEAVLYVSLFYRQSNISQNAIEIFVLEKKEISNVNSTVAGFAGQQNLIDIHYGSMLLPYINQNMVCGYNNTLHLATHIGNSIFRCTVSGEQNGVLEISLHFIRGGTNILVSSNTISFVLFEKTPLLQERNIFLTSQYISFKIASESPLLNASYVPLIRCKIGENFYPYLNELSGFSQCDKKVNEETSLSFSLWYQASSNLILPFSINEFNIYIFNESNHVTSITPSVLSTERETSVRLKVYRMFNDYGTKITYKAHYLSNINTLERLSDIEFRNNSFKYDTLGSGAVEISVSSFNTWIFQSGQNAMIEFIKPVYITYSDIIALTYNTSHENIVTNISITTSDSIGSGNKLCCLVFDPLSDWKNLVNAKKASDTEVLCENVQIDMNHFGKPKTLYLALKLSINETEPFNVSINSSPILIIRDPNFEGINQVLYTSDISADLDFIIPSNTNFSYYVKMAEVDASQLEIHTYLECILNQNQKGNCELSPMDNAKFSPAIYRFYLILEFGATNNTFLMSNQYYYRKNVTIQHSHPFLVNPAIIVQTPQNVKLTTQKILHHGFQYECIVHVSDGYSYSMQMISDTSNFYCPIMHHTIVVNETALVHINITSPPLLQGIISDDQTAILLVLLKTIPNLSMSHRSTEFKIHVENGELFKVPPLYQSLAFSLNFETIVKTSNHLCDINNAGNLNCTYFDNFPVNSIMAFTMKLRQFGIDIVQFYKPFILYKDDNVTSMRPEATLRDVSANLLLNFHHAILDDKGTLNAHSLQPQFACVLDGIHYNGTQRNSSMIQCPMQYTTEFNNHNTVMVSAIFSIYSIGIQNVVISKKEIPFYFLDQGVISFFNDTLELIYKDYHEIYVQIDGAWLPNTIRDRFKCKLSTSQYTASQYLQSYSESIHQYRCSFHPSHHGLIETGLWYQDQYSDHLFSLSNNTVNFVVVKNPQPVNGLSPLASLIGNVDIEIFSVFDTERYYGENISFVCKYGNSFEFTTNATAFPNGKFVCHNVYSNTTVRYVIAVWIVGRNSELRITDERQFRFVETGFLVPSDGIRSGGEIAIMERYNKEEAHNITFTNHTEIIFNCFVKNQSLECTTPNLNGISPDYIPSFKSYLLSLKNETLAVEYVLYEKRSITILPNVFPYPFVREYGDPSIEIVTNEGITVEEGHIGFSLHNFNFQFASAFEETFRFHMSIISPLIHSKGAGEHFVSLIYQNQELLTPSVVISHESIPIQFIPSFIIQLEADTNILNVNTSVNSTFYLSQEINQKYWPFIKCLMNNEVILETAIISNNSIQCTLSNNMHGVVAISVWYVDEVNAWNQRFRISENEIPIIFFRNISLDRIIPFATLSNSSVVNITSVQTDFFAYTGFATYKCMIGNVSTNAIIVSDSSLSCTLNSEARGRMKLHISISSNYKDAQMIISANYLPFYFVKQSSLSSLEPSIYSISSSEQNLNSNINISISNSLLVKHGLFCHYHDAFHEIKISEAIVINNQMISCNFSVSVLKSPFVSKVSLHVHPAYDSASILNFQLSTNELKIYMIRTPILFNQQIVHENQTDQFFELSLAIPSEHNLIFKAIDHICNFTNGENVSCYIPKPNLEHILQEYDKLKITIQDSLSNSSLQLIVQHMVIYKSTQITKIAPYMLNFHRYIHPFTKNIKVFQQAILQTNYRYECSIYFQSANQNIFFNATILSNDTVSCAVNGIGIEEKGFLSLQLVYLSQRFLLTEIPVALYFRKPPIIYNNIVPARGKYDIYFDVNRIPDSQDYEFKLKYREKSNFIDLSICNSLSSDRLSCTLPELSDQHAFMPLSLFIDDIHCIELWPHLKVYGAPVVTKIIPSNIIFSKTSHQDLIFVGNNFFKDSNIKARFTVIENANSSQISLCTFHDNNRIACKMPQISIAQHLKQINVNVSISYDFSYFMPLTSFSIINDSDIVIESLSSSECDVHIPKSITIDGRNFVDLGDVRVKYYDSLVTEELNATMINHTRIQTMTPNILFAMLPRKLFVAVTFDGGIHYIDAPKDLTLHCSAGLTLSFLPQIAYHTITEFMLHIISFPSSNGNIDDRFEFMLEGETNESFKPVSIPLDCVSNKTDILNTSIVASCSLRNSSLIPKEPSKVWLNVYQRDAETLGLELTNIRSHHPLLFIDGDVFSDVRPKVVFLKKTKNIILSGKFTEGDKGVMRFVHLEDPNHFYDMKNKELKQSSIVFAKKQMSKAGQYKILWSMNEGFSFFETNLTVNVQDDVIISRIVSSNTLLQSGTTMSDVPSTIMINGQNFFNTTMIVMLTNGVLERRFTEKDLRIVSRSEQRIQMESPLISNITKNTDWIRYPIVFGFLLSFNDGHDYFETKLAMTNRMREPLITRVHPTIIPLMKQENITIEGRFMSHVTECQFYVGQRLISSQKSISLDPLPAVKCLSPKGISDSLNIRLLNSFGEYSSIIRTDQYVEPIIGTMSNTSSPSQGGGYLFITDNRTRTWDFGLKFRIRFGQVIHDEECIFAFYRSRTELRCPIIFHEPTTLDVSISPNLYNWYQLPNQFTFYGCPAGSSTPEARENCKPCMKGYYKPTEGNYPCSTCPRNQYADNEGMDRCKSCPPNSHTIRSDASSIYDCACNIGYMINPREHLPAERCIICPTGGYCGSVNETNPVALPGYWLSSRDNHTFYQCHPHSSCPGGRAENCSEGYTGQVCGMCERGYFKWRKRCTECLDGAWWRFILFILLVAIVVVGFFALSSISIKHVSSISIGLSLWQVIALFSKFDVDWPEVLAISFQTASTSNFNLDFVSPQCIFPDLTFVHKWIFVMSLPVVVMIGFILLYILGVIRNELAGCFGRFLPFKYWRYDYGATKISKQNNVQKLFWTFNRLHKNTWIWLRNFCLWFLKEKLVPIQMKRFFNKCVNAYLTFVSFSFIFIMTTASEIFICNEQPDGRYTLNESPNMFCYEGEWYTMLPFALLYYFVGMMFILFFLIVYLMKDGLKRKSDFSERFRFVLKRFKKKYVFWEGIVILRKLSLSVMYILLHPMFVVVIGIFVIFISLCLHMQFVPYKRKMHNLMEYVVLTCTLLTLFFGLLFYLDINIAAFDTVAAILSVTIITLSTVIVIILMIWDIITRRKKEGKKLKKWKKKLNELGVSIPSLTTQQVTFLPKAFNKRHDLKQLTKLELLISMKEEEKKNIEILLEQEPKFTLPFFESDTSTDEDQSQTLNDIYSSLFSAKRLRRKKFLVTRKKNKALQKLKSITSKKKIIVKANQSP